MKKISYLLSLMFVALGFSSCNESSDFDIDYTSIAPIGGHYIVDIYAEEEDASESGLSDAEFWANHSCTDENLYVSDYAFLSNTSDYSTTQAWIRIGYSYSYSDDYTINGKVAIDMSNYTFSGTNIENLTGNVTSSDNKFNISGFVKLNDITTPGSSTVTNRIEFTYTLSDNPGVRFKAVGYKYTGWTEDDHT